MHPWYDLPAGVPESATAIGEAGLDRIKGINWEKQLQRFRLACEMAESSHKPLILHEVRAFEEIKQILRSYAIPAILRHGWRSDSITKLEAALRENWYIGCGVKTPENILIYFREHPGMQQKLTLESDDDQASLHPLYRKTAYLLGVTEKELQDMMLANFHRFTGR